jgi:sphingomyelin phosphodiesterase
MNVAFISSSLTTYTDKLPSFRKFIVDAKTMIPMNYYEYRLDLDKYN